MACHRENTTKKSLSVFVRGVVFLATALVIETPMAVAGHVSYQFERAWPDFSHPGYLRGPEGIAVAPDGSVYVADTVNNRIQQFTASGVFIRTWGSVGSGDGQFGSPSGVAIGPDGSVYVGDKSNHRIQQFTADGVFVRKWGDYVWVPWPTALAVGPDGSVYVADAGDYRIQQFTADGMFIRDWACGGYNITLVGIAVGVDGSVYVAQDNGDIQQFTATGTFVRSFFGAISPGGIATGADGTIYVVSATTGVWQLTADGIPVQPWLIPLGLPGGIAVAANGALYVTDTASGLVQQLTAPGEYGYSWGATGQGNGQFHDPESIATAPDGSVYVTDTENSRIQRFTQDGVFVSTWGSAGSSDGQFSYPFGVAVGMDGSIYVADTGNHRVQQFTSAGVFLRKWGSQGAESGKFNGPRGITVNVDGSVYVVDTGNDRIQQFTNAGVFIRTWGTPGTTAGQFDTPSAIAIGKEGSVYVADTNNHRIQKFSSVGTFIRAWGSMGSDIGQFLSPSGLAVDQDGILWVADTENNRIQWINDTGVAMDLSFVGYGSLSRPTGVVLGLNGSIYIIDIRNNQIREYRRINWMETHRFERFWPTIQQPWYFWYPAGIATGPDGLVYIADASKGCIQQFTADGCLVRRWGSEGSDDGQLLGPHGVAVGLDGSVYVSETGNSRIQQFTGDGTFLRKWGDSGSGDGQFYRPDSIVVGRDGSVYVADSGNNRVQQFTADGVFVRKWGYHGTDVGLFRGPEGITVGMDGSVYVADSRNYRIQQFTSDGVFIRTWGSQGSGDGQFGIYVAGPIAIATALDGSVYVGDMNNARVQEFTAEGVFVRAWGGYNYDDGQPLHASGCAIGTDGTVYVTSDNAVLKCTEDGIPAARWDSGGTGDGQFHSPLGVAIGPDGLIYVADAGNNRIQQFTGAGDFVRKWDATGSGNIAIGVGGSVYVADSQNHRIQRFTTDGVLVRAWGSEGWAPGQFQALSDIATGPDGSVYASDTGNHCVQQFNAAGDFVRSWGTYGTGDGQFNMPAGVAVSPGGAVYVSDTGNYRVEEFTATGDFVRAWVGPAGLDIAVGPDGSVYLGWYARYTAEGVFVSRMGGGPNEFASMGALAVGAEGNVYVLDSTYNRIQKFKPAVVTDYAKAVVVSGGGPFPGNNLWAATEASANFAYRALNYQGFTKDTTYYLSSDTQLDLDNNDVADDVNDTVTGTHLEYALTTWAPTVLNGLPTSDIVIYLVDHGGDGTFRLNANETLSAADLASWVNTLQAGIQGKVIVVLDACHSGSFVPALAVPPEHPEWLGKRIVITSTLPEEVAYFTNVGTISLSNYFWTQIFNGVPVGEAFNLAYDAMRGTYNYQTPQLDDTGNGVGNESDDGGLAATTYIGNGTRMNWAGPSIGNVSNAQTLNGTTSATLWADPVTDPDGIARVWAMIRPPDFQPTLPGATVTGMPSVDLQPVSDNRYEGTWTQFSTPGIYDIIIYARDRVGNTSAPKTTHVTVVNPLHRRALLVAGGTTSDSLWPSYEHCGRMAYDALRFQGYDDSDIYYLSQTSTVGVDGLGTLSNIQYGITTWAVNQGQDLTIYLVGPGTDGSFQVNATESLQPSQLDTWLDTLQSTLPGKVTVIYDANNSSSFLSALTPVSGKVRYVVASSSSTQKALFARSGNISFSKFFWDRVLNGTTLEMAFKYAKNSIKCNANIQDAALDDDGNGTYDTKKDGIACRNYLIGSGIMLAADPPMIGQVCDAQTLTGGSEAVLWVDQVTTTGTIDKVWAAILPPGADTPATVELLPTGGNRYEGNYGGFADVGVYGVSIYAMDTDGGISTPIDTSVEQQVQGIAPDAYEVDDTSDQASWIGVDGPEQDHSFHNQGDADWARFYANPADGVVTIETSDLGTVADTYVELFASDGTTLLASDDNSGSEPRTSKIQLTPLSAGFYLVKATNIPDTAIGPEAMYTLHVWHELASTSPGTLSGNVTDAGTSLPLEGATVTLTSFGNVHATTDADGEYTIPALPMQLYAVLAAKAGYHSQSVSDVEVNSGTLTTQNFALVQMVPPTAAFAADTTTGPVPLTVHFADQSVQGSGSITGWHWTFGDGATSDEPNPTHTYDTLGTFTVSLAVTTVAGSDTETKSSYITTERRTDVTVDFTALPVSGAPPLEVQFTDTSSMDPLTIISYTWDFGDGTPVNHDQNPIHAYANDGVYTVSLTVDTNGGSYTQTHENLIAVQSPLPALGGLALIALVSALTGLGLARSKRK